MLLPAGSPGRPLTHGCGCTHHGSPAILGLSRFGAVPSAKARSRGPRPCLHVTPTLGSSPSFPYLMYYCALPNHMRLPESLVNTKNSEIAGVERSLSHRRLCTDHSHPNVLGGGTGGH